MTRCLFVLEVPVSYRTGWLEHTRAESDMDIHVIYLTKGQPDRPWEEEAVEADWVHFAEALALGGTRRGFFPRVSRKLTDQISHIDPDLVIIPGWAHPAAWQAALWCRRRDRPYGVMFESWKSQSQTRVPAPISRSVRKRILDGADLVLPVGERAHAFSTSLGRADAHIVHGNTCDVESIIADTAGLESRPDPTALFVGRLMPHKGTRLLLDALEPLTSAGVRVKVIGDGPDRQKIEAAARQSELVEFLGPLSPKESRQQMATSGVVLVPSLEEPWGVVVHEALASGTPVVATDAVGSTTDLMTAASVVVVGPSSAAIVEGALDVLGRSDSRADVAEACRTAASRVTYQSATNELIAAVATLTQTEAHSDTRTVRRQTTPPNRPKLVIDARTARTGGGATVLRVIEEQLVPSLVGIDVEVRRPSNSLRDLRAHAAAPLTTRRDKPDVVLALSEAGNLGAGASGRTIMMARNWNCWTPAATMRRRARSAVARRNAGIADTVLVATEVFAEAIRPVVHAAAEVEVLPFGIGAHFTPDGPSASGQYFLCVGDWYPWKSFEIAVEAFADIADDLPDASLRIAGHPIHADYRDATLERAKALGLDGRVEALGSVAPDELSALYRGAVATVATSDLESFGHPYLEALACGSPLIGRRMPVTEELVGGCAVLVDGSRSGFASAMLDAAENPSAGRRAAGLSRAAEFSWGQYTTRLRALIVDGIG